MQYIYFTACIELIIALLTFIGSWFYFDIPLGFNMNENLFWFFQFLVSSNVANTFIRFYQRLDSSGNIPPPCYIFFSVAHLLSFLPFFPSFFLCLFQFSIPPSTPNLCLSSSVALSQIVVKSSE